MKDCYESYRLNFPHLAARDLYGFLADTSPHAVAFRSGWAASNTRWRDKHGREIQRRKVAEAALTKAITPKA